MKKIIVLLLFLCAYKFNFSQNHGNGNHSDNTGDNSKWNVYGNVNDPDDVLGTTNNFPIKFITNNVQRMVLGNDGVLNINNLAGIGNRILTADANGNLTVLPGNISTAISSWNSNGSNIYLSSGNLGIGTTNPIISNDFRGNKVIFDSD